MHCLIEAKSAAERGSEQRFIALHTISSAEWMDQPSRKTWTLLPAAAMLLASEMLYLSLLRLNAINGVRPVLTFLATLGDLGGFGNFL